MTEQNALENILEDAEEATAEVGQEDTNNAEVTDSTKGEEQAVAKPKEEESWTKAAVLAERRKRQALEEENRRLKSGEAPKPAARPDVLEDQDGAFNHVEAKLSQALLNERINLSREFMIDKHDDYELMETEFADMCKDNPQLVVEMQRSSNPAKFAYQTAKNATEIKKLSDPQTREEIKAQMKAEILAELNAQNGEEEEQDPKEVRRTTALKTPKLVKATSAQSGMAVPKAKTLNELFPN